jgi:hypothetical protein
MTKAPVATAEVVRKERRERSGEFMGPFQGRRTE